LFLVSVRAEASIEDQLGLRVRATVSGNEMPAFVIEPVEPVRSLLIKLTRQDGRRLQVGASNVAAGSKRELRVQQPNGSYTYKAEFQVLWGSGEKSEFEMSYKLTRSGKLELFVKPGDIDLDAGTMSFKLSNPASHAELLIVLEGGQKLPLITKSYNNAPAGSVLSLRWKAPHNIDHMDFKAYDQAGFWKAIRITPFTIAIPHDDVVFDNAKWNIKKSEEPKLEDTMGQIRDALKKHGTLLQLELYVAGYTDTVGSPSYNQNLSTNRARSIAAWFAAHGLRIPIHYQGFGEEILAVPTPDETPEPKNRRALYILSAQLPVGIKSIPRQDWRSLSR